MRNETIRFMGWAMLVLLVLAALPFSLSHAQETFVLPEGKVGVAYEFRIQTEGGLAPLQWKLVQGELPPGIELLPSGTLRGIPTSPQREPFQFTVEVSDSSLAPQTFLQPFALLIRPASLRMVLGSSKLKIVPLSRNDAVAPGSGPALSSRPSDPEAAAEGGKPRWDTATLAPKATGELTTAPAQTMTGSLAAKAEASDELVRISTPHAVTPATVPAQAAASSSGPAPGSTTPGSSIFTRLLTGVDLSAASSLPSQQKFFLDFTLNHPVHFFNRRDDQKDPFKHRIWTWLDFRVTALPDQAAAALQSLGTTNDFFGTLLKNKNQQVVQGMEFLSGLEFPLHRPAHVSQHLLLSSAIVFAIGATTPFSVPDRTQQEFNVNPSVSQLFPGVVKGCKDAMEMRLIAR